MAGGGDLPQPLPLILAELGDPGNEIFRSVSQTMLTQTMQLANFFRLAADRVFFFGALAPSGQLATHNYVFLDIDNSLSFQQAVGLDASIEIIQYLGFTDRFFAPPLKNSLRLRQGESVNETIVGALGNQFNWNEHDAPLFEALRRSYIVNDSLGFTDIVVGVSATNALNQFAFTNTVDSAATNYARAPTHSVIQQHLSYSVTGGSGCQEKQYTPFVGESDNSPFPPVSETPPVLGTATLLLVYQQLDPFQVFAISLKNPEFGNQDNLTYAKIDRKTTGGARKIFSDLSWGETQSLRLSIRDLGSLDPLCGLTLDDLINFLNVSLGKIVELTDWENRIWSGIIIAQETEIRQEQGGMAVDIIFEGKVI